jgi:hypothetical protein
MGAEGERIMLFIMKLSLFRSRSISHRCFVAFLVHLADHDSSFRDEIVGNGDVAAAPRNDSAD